MNETCGLKITIGTVLTRSEAEEILRDNDISWDDYDSSYEAFKRAAEIKYNEGLGCDVVAFGE